MIQKWIVFAADATESQINWWMSRNKDAAGYFLGIAPILQPQADAEGWTLPHIWEETV